VDEGEEYEDTLSYASEYTAKRYSTYNVNNQEVQSI
jgi:hypothetical protein